MTAAPAHPLRRLLLPQIHVVQYPLDMGRKDKRGASGEQTLALTVGEGGGINYDALIRQGANRDKWIATEHSAMVPKVDQLKAEVRTLYCAAASFPCNEHANVHFPPCVVTLDVPCHHVSACMCRASCAL